MQAPDLSSVDATLVHHALDSEAVRVDGARRIVTRCTGTIFTAFLLLIVGIGVLSLPLNVVNGDPMGFVSAAIAAFFAYAAWFRHRRLGTFVLDVETDRIQQWRGARQIGEWPLREARFSLAWDPLRRAKHLQYWLVARAPGSPGLRIARGSTEELQPLQDELRGLGLHVD